MCCWNCSLQNFPHYTNPSFLLHEYRNKYPEHCFVDEVFDLLQKRFSSRDFWLDNNALKSAVAIHDPENRINQVIIIIVIISIIIINIIINIILLLLLLLL